MTNMSKAALISIRYRGRFMALGGLAALILGACGSTGANSSSSTSSTPIVIAAAAGLTGQYAADGIPVPQGALAAAAEINAAGGVLGRKLQIDPVDTVSDAADAVPALRKEFSCCNPAAIVGMQGGEIQAAQPIFDAAHIPDCWMGGSPTFDTNTDPWLWRGGPSDSQLGVAMAVYARQKGYNTAVTFITNSADSQTLVPSITQPFQRLGGTILANIGITPGQTSYLSEAQRVVNLHPDVIFAQLTPGDAGVVFTDFQELKETSIPWIGTDQTAAPSEIQAIGPSLAKSEVTSIQGSTALTSAGQEFTQWSEKANGHAPLARSANSYDCVIVFALAMTYAHSSDPNKWVPDITDVSNPPGITVSDYGQAVADIHAGKKINYEGASGPMDFNKYHNLSGAWDVVQSNGDSAGDTVTLTTITADEIQAAVAKIG